LNENISIFGLKNLGNRKSLLHPSVSKLSLAASRLALHSSTSSNDLITMCDEYDSMCGEENGKTKFNQDILLLEKNNK